MNATRVYLTALVLLIMCGTFVHGELLTVFRDDFEAYDAGADPEVPPVGEPWQIVEVADNGVFVGNNVWEPDNQSLNFGLSPSSALAPFSASHSQQISDWRYLSIGFDYFGKTPPDATDLSFFDVSLMEGGTGERSLLFRIDAWEYPAGSDIHDIYYIGPAGGLLDSGLDVVADTLQRITVTADLPNETFELDVNGNSQTLPMFFCPEDIVGVEFATVGVSAGSGVIDNVEITTTNIPEPPTIWPFLVAGVIVACGWVLKVTAVFSSRN